jgi:hypothetical protein
MVDRALAAEIMDRVRCEQMARTRYLAGKGKRVAYKKLDQANAKWLKAVLLQRGWPTYTLVGKKAADGAWMLVQHADHDVQFQKRCLRLMRALYRRRPREISKKRIAFLTDRICYNEGKPQIFGIMFDIKGVKATPYPIRNPNTVNKRRRAYGLKITVEGRRRALERELRKFRTR